jgi:regulation of enolase protein 1 (concanavalin A-like superfamily)
VHAAAALPSGWTNQDVGTTGKAGSTTYDWPSSTFTIKGAGADVWGTADAFQYAYRPLSGDGVMIARVATVSSTAPWVKAGAMIRETLDPGSAQAFMLVSYSRGSAFQRRTVAGGPSTNTAGPNVTAPYWVKIERIGSTINGYVSPDGSTWTLVGSDSFTMAAKVTVGLAISSHVNGTLATATFDNASAPSVPCSFSISPSTQTFDAGGGSATIALTASDPSCTWTATSSDTSWLTVTSAASGSGNALVGVSAAANSAAARSATVTIGGQTFSASQPAAGCSYAISPSSQSMAIGGDTATVSVTTGSWCSWTAVSNDTTGWLTVTSGASGTGSGTVTLGAAANSGLARSATATIASQTFTASQPPAPGSCHYAVTPPSQTVPVGGGSISITMAADAGCSWSAASDSEWLTITSGASGVGSVTVAATAAANTSAARAATVTVAGLTSMVTQAAPALPGSFANQDVGTTGKAGSTTYDWSANVWTIQGAGADIWGTADAFQYAFESMTGDGLVIARVASVSNTNAWAKAGVMIRETLDPSSAQALMLVSYSKGLAFQRRDAARGTSVNTAGTIVTAPYWVKLQRTGNTFNAYSSPDGSAWTLVGSDTIPMAATVYVGLAVTSHVSGTLATATFDNVTVP